MKTTTEQFAAFDRYTGQQVGAVHTTRAAAENARPRGFRTMVCQRLRGDWTPCV